MILIGSVDEFDDPGYCMSVIIEMFGSMFRSGKVIHSIFCYNIFMVTCISYAEQIECFFLEHKMTK